MRLKDVNAAELTELVGIGDAPGEDLHQASTLLPDDGAGPLELTQEVPVEMLASEFEAPPDFKASSRPPSGLFGIFHVQWVRWAEKRHAQLTTRTVVARYRNIVERYPELPTRDALCLLVMEHTRCDVGSARRVLANAENSFSSWQYDRSLNLVDVAHYLATSEFLALHRRENGIRSDVGQLVAALVPRELLAQRPRPDAAGQADPAPAGF